MFIVQQAYARLCLPPATWVELLRMNPAREDERRRGSNQNALQAFSNAGIDRRAQGELDKI
jgi:hypothetical protein